MESALRVDSSSPLALVWGKTIKGTEEVHPLICHLIDVSQVAQVLWERGLSEAGKRHFSRLLGLGFEETGRLLAFWAGLHDLGKASPCFQRKHEASRQQLEIHLPFPDKFGQEKCHHGAITSITLEELLQDEMGLPEEWATNVAIAIGGHHGSWPTDQEMSSYGSRRLGKGAWKQVRRDLFLQLKKIIAPPSISPLYLPPETLHVFFVLLSGLTSVADWLGSREEYFGPQLEASSIEGYVRLSAEKALQALKEQGWIGWQPDGNLKSFEEMFAHIVPAGEMVHPNSMQEVVIANADMIEPPALVILEAPTGGGKTEAALYLADRWIQRTAGRGLYVAMPTMATSNEMYKRVSEVLTCRYSDMLVNYHLLHGNALLKEDDQVPRLAKIESDDEGKGTVAALSWFTKRKRGLLAPFAVGTVDQVLLSILQTPHFFVRLFGLSRKTVIFDEVHAYDTYMDELFTLLLRWLRVMGTSVVVLSATLPTETRRKLVEAYNGQPVDMPDVGYPAVIWTTGGKPEVIQLPRLQGTFTFVESVSRQPETIAQKLKEYLREGGCAAVICNTVRRAQQVYEAVRRAGIISDPEKDLTLFHARFPSEERERIEEKVRKQFGKPEGSQRPKKAIVVATQVIEQSLDLDFDLMVSDLAPIDMIIQRIGRLHRHEREGERPKGLEEPKLLLAMPEEQDSLPVFERGDVYVYGRYLLLRSYLVLKGKDTLTTPDETQALIEAVYGPEVDVPEAFRQALRGAHEEMEKDQTYARCEAAMKCIPPPDAKYLLEEPNAALEEDNPELHRYRQAATRLAPPSITLICLTRRGGDYFLRPSSKSPAVDLKEEPDFDATRKLLNRKIDVTDYRLVKHFSEEDVLSGWRENAWLRHARHVPFDEERVYDPEPEPWLLKLDPDLGLIVEKKEDETR